MSVSLGTATPTENVARLAEVDQLVARWASPETETVKKLFPCDGLNCKIIKRRVVEALDAAYIPDKREAVKKLFPCDGLNSKLGVRRRLTPHAARGRVQRGRGSA
ncbi:hypothetical protein LTS10_011882 [Elasticomyces elasticus]|nr:hypothetical protein LTS10_011882 [Elasticomyces elasticus]